MAAGPVKAARERGRLVDVIGVDLSGKMLDVFQQRYPGTQVFCGDFVEYVPPTLPKENEADDEEELSKVQSVVFNACFANLYDPAAHLQHACDVLSEGGTVVISHPLGSACTEKLHARDARMVPHALPAEAALRRMARHLPLRVDAWRDRDGLYLAALTRVRHALLRDFVCAYGAVGRGFGRGGKKLGVPTANLQPDGDGPLRQGLADLPTGVYIGWALVEEDGAGAGSSSAQRPVKAVVNVGFSPTFEERNPEKIIEAHLIGRDPATSGDFYGAPMRLLLAGFLRPERRFAGFPQLVAAIRKDVADAAAALDTEPYRALAEHAFFALPGGAALPAWRRVPSDGEAGDDAPAQ
ncbi:hypothetical protein JKP88DRAFT_293985 [Tribonema minus]|uniref:riboflavin kinase n=1 Tax=Tribonema minus TaxID=303371 RepID=A0A836CMR2_9STRA|nr:hypothetical protein JKP88DRAFT_293985 [Tribonema minus]